MNVTFDGIYNEIIENMHHFASEEKDFSKLTQYKDLISKTIDEVVEEVFNDIFSYEKQRHYLMRVKERNLRKILKIG